MSNRLEELFEELQNKVFQKKPFSKVYILISDRTIKSWLYRKLCKRSTSEAILGLEIYHLQDGIYQISKDFFSKEVLLPQTLLFETEQFLKRIRQGERTELSLEDAKAIEDILQNCSKKGFFQLVQEFYHLAFMKKYFSLEPKVQKYTVLHSLIKLLPIFLRQFPDENIQTKVDIDLHFFGIVSLGKKFIEVQERFRATYYYVLSPCMMFWSDICSDKEAHHYANLFSKQNTSQSGQIAYDALLFDRNPLLANCGHLGRDFTLLLEDKTFDFIERYVVYKWANEIFSDEMRMDALTNKAQDQSPQSLLGIIQTSLLLLQGPKNDKVRMKDDSSFSIYCAKSLLEEVEALYDEIARFCEKSKKVLEPCSICVLTPFLERYRPYIERVFCIKHENFDFEILSSAKEQQLYKSFLDLFTLDEKRWNKQAIISVLECGPVQKKLKISNADMYLIIDAFDALGFLWGMNDEHCTNILKKVGISETSFEHNFLKMERSFFEKFMTQKSQLDVHTAEIICSVFSYFSSLYSDLLKFFKSEKTPFEWAKDFEEFQKNYFEVDAGIGFYKGFSTLAKIENDFSKTIDFETCLFHLHEIFRDIRSNSYEFIQKPIVFASIEDVHAHPCKMLCFLGLDDDAFTNSSFEKEREYGYLFLQNKNQAWQVACKYFFISAICGAREKLHISYQGYSNNNREKQNPHDAVSDLLRSIDLVAEVETEKNNTTNCLKENFCSIEEKSQWNFFTKKTKTDSCIEIEKLRSHAKNPLKTYFQNALNIFVPFSLNEEFQDPDLAIPRFTFNQTCKEMLFEKQSEHIPVFPTGIMKEVHAIRLFEKEKLFEENRLKLNLSQKPHTLEFSLQKENVSPISVEVDGKTIFLTGRIEGCVSNGIIVPSKKSKHAMYKHWPDLLIFAARQKELFGIDELFLYFLLDGNVEKFTCTNPKKALSEYVRYYLESQIQPFGLFPDVIDKLKNTDFTHTEWQNALHSSFYYLDPHMKMFLQGISQDLLKELWMSWQIKAKTVFLENHDEF